jgi:hypothetical protein
MSKRSQWCEFDKETRKYIKKRDKDQCVICGEKGALQIMHIFLNRSHGGKGCKENGCLGCVKCHKILDNPIGVYENTLSKEYQRICEYYLIEKEHLTIDKDFLNMLQYKKEIEKIEIDLSPKVYKKRCKTCKFLIKSKASNSSIPSYYCKYRHISLNKNTEACKSYR